MSEFETKRYLVTSFEKASTKRGKEYLRMRLTAVGGQVFNAVCWEPKQRPPLEKGQVADVIAEEENSPEYGLQLNVKAFRLSEKQVEGSEFLPQAKVDIDALLETLREFVGAVADPGIRQVLDLTLEDERWRRAPAATRHHHAYLGGLLEHTVNLCRLADMMCGLYSLRYDLLVAAAILHDSGKMAEMSYDTVLDYTTEGQLLGHIVIGYRELVIRMNTITKELLPRETRLLLEHLLLSHHGAVAYGSPKAPQVLEAVVFSGLDGLDANIGACMAAAAAAEGKEWTAKTATGQAMYLGKKEEK